MINRISLHGMDQEKKYRISILILSAFAITVFALLLYVLFYS